MHLTPQTKFFYASVSEFFYLIPLFTKHRMKVILRLPKLQIRRIKCLHRRLVEYFGTYINFLIVIDFKKEEN